ENQGAVVEDVTSKDSPAARSGIQSGDIILAVNGQKVKNKADLVRQIAALPVGSAATITFLRNGQERTASVRLNERRDQKSRDLVFPYESRPADPVSPDPDDQSRSSGPRQNQKADPDQSRPSSKPPLGLSVQTLSPDRAGQIGLTGAQGVLIVKVEP